MTLKNIITTLIIAFILNSTLQAQNQNNDSSKIEHQEQAQIIKKTYTLKGFKQSCCTRIVDYALKEVKGYLRSEANVKTQELTVWFNTNLSKEADIKNAINKTAYKIIE